MDESLANACFVLTNLIESVTILGQRGNELDSSDPNISKSLCFWLLILILKYKANIYMVWKEIQRAKMKAFMPY